MEVQQYLDEKVNHCIVRGLFSVGMARLCLPLSTVAFLEVTCVSLCLYYEYLHGIGLLDVPYGIMTNDGHQLCSVINQRFNIFFLCKL